MRDMGRGLPKNSLVAINVNLFLFRKAVFEDERQKMVKVQFNKNLLLPKTRETAHLE
jgi:hypothetical protein